MSHLTQRKRSRHLNYNLVKVSGYSPIGSADTDFSEILHEHMIRDSCDSLGGISWP